MQPLRSTRHRGVATDIVLIAAWFGLVTGLVEGTSLLALQTLGWQSWAMAKLAVSPEIIWISAFFDLAVFCVFGVALAGVALFFPRLAVVRAAVFLFVALTCFDWLDLTGRLLSYAVLALAIGAAVVFTRWFRAHEGPAVRFWRTSAPWVALLAVIVLAAIQGGLWLQERMAIAKLPAPSANTPNVLVVIVDTLRADHVASYGYARSTSPSIDRVAQQGVLFENAFATSAWTPPSHASILTGRYPHEHNVDWAKELDGRFPTVAEALRDRGYRTGAFSANPFGFNRGWGFGRGFIRFEDHFHSIGDMAARTLYGRKLGPPLLRWVGFEDWIARKRASDVTRSALRWIGRDPQTPFFAFLNYFDAHDPYLPPEPYRSRFSTMKNPGGLLNSVVFRYEPVMTAEQLQGEIDAYDGAIAYVDDSIGHLLAGLQQMGMSANTVVVIASDHGEAFGEHGLFFHQNALYRELIHVPLIFWWPGHLPAATHVAAAVSLAALPATIMELVGAETQALFPSPSLAPLWKEPDAPHDWGYPLAELAQQPFKPLRNSPAYSGWTKSLAGSQWHYISHEKLDAELYDWRADPAESTNLAATPEGQGVASAFAVRLQELLRQVQKASRDSFTRWLPGWSANRHPAG